MNRLGLHSSAIYAPYREMTIMEKDLSAIAVALALKPKALVLSGELADPEVLVKMISEDVLPLVWADCGEACKALLLGLNARVLDANEREDGAVARSNFGDHRKTERPRRWPERPGATSSALESAFVIGGAWAALMSPVLAEVGERLASARRDVPQTAMMNDVHFWQLLVASLAIIVVLIGQWRLGIGLGRSLAIAAIRCVIQLNILGYLLVPVFEKDTPWLVLGFLCVMLVVAAQECMSSRHGVPF